jgi:hypothetical protein
MVKMRCSRPYCQKKRLKICAGCLKGGYCSRECQKFDRKIHKIMCACMKNDEELATFSEFKEKLDELMNQSMMRKGTESAIRILVLICNESVW